MAFVPSIISLGLFGILFFSSEKIAEYVFRSDKNKEDSKASIDMKSLEILVISSIGIVFICQSLPKVSKDLIDLFLGYKRFDSQVVSRLVQFMIALILFFLPEKIVSLRMRN